MFWHSPDSPVLKYWQRDRMWKVSVWFSHGLDASSFQATILQESGGAATRLGTSSMMKPKNWIRLDGHIWPLKWLRYMWVPGSFMFGPLPARTRIRILWQWGGPIRVALGLLVNSWIFKKWWDENRMEVPWSFSYIFSHIFAMKTARNGGYPLYRYTILEKTKLLTVPSGNQTWKSMENSQVRPPSIVTKTKQCIELQVVWKEMKKKRKHMKRWKK